MGVKSIQGGKIDETVKSAEKRYRGAKWYRESRAKKWNKGGRKAQFWYRGSRKIPIFVKGGGVPKCTPSTLVNGIVLRLKKTLRAIPLKNLRF